MSSYYQKINTLYKRDMTKPKKPIILGEYSEPEFEVLKDLKWEATEKIDGTNMSCCFHPGFRMIEIRGKTENASIPTHLHKRMEELFQFDLLYKAFGVQTETGEIVPLVGYMTIKEAEDFVKAGFKSLIAENKDYIAEGLVLKAPCGLLNRRGKRIITKIKYCDYKDL